MPNRRRGRNGGGGDGTAGLHKKAEDLATQVSEGAGQWNTDAHQIATDAQDYAQNNPFSQSAASYNDALLGGDISRNPFMGTIHNATQGVNPQQDLDWLRSYSGQANGNGTSTSGQPQNSKFAGKYKSSKGGGGGLPPTGPQGGGQVPDTVGGQNTFFAQQMRDLFDPKHLDPANDPTLKPTIDMMQSEAKEDYLRNLSGLNAQAQAGGRYGSGLYQAMRGQQIDEQTEGVSQAIAQQLMGAYQAQQGRRMDGLGMTNTRDIAAMNDQTQRYGIDSAAASSGAGIAAQMADAAENRRLQAMGMNLDAQLGLLGLAGNMGSVLQQGQNAALNSGIGYGQLGMSGYDTAINAGGLGMQGLGMQAGIAQGMANQANARDNMQYQREQARYGNQQDALNDYMNIIMGVGGMGGSGYEYSQGPGAQAEYRDPMASAVGSGIGAGMQIYGGLNPRGGGGQ
jgi:hypothetical protein